MSRLGDMIRNERSSKQLPAKQVAKKAGISEKYLLEVESGRRIVESATAQRILKVMGAAGDAMDAIHDVERAPTPQAPAPVPRQQGKAAKNTPVNDQWMDALGGIVRSVPVMNVMGKQVDTRVEATQGGRIAGVAADKVFYQKVEDDSLWRTHSIKKGDLLLTVPGSQDGLLVLEVEGVRRIGRILEQGPVVVMLLGDERKTAASKQVQVLGSVSQLVRQM